MGNKDCFRDAAERNELFEDIERQEVALEALAGLDEKRAERRKLTWDIDDLWDEYGSRLPFHSLSVCPFCDETFKLQIDPFGYDGKWWASSRRVKGACEHYVVIRQAVNLNGQRVELKPQAQVSFGPSVPYVIERLFGVADMACVMSRLDFTCGYTYYPMVYFAERPPPRNDLKCGKWAYPYKGSFETVEDAWLFEFRRYVDSGQVRLASITDGKATLEPRDPDAFPFLDLPGHRGEQRAEGSDLKLSPPPHPSHSHYAGPSD